MGKNKVKRSVCSKVKSKRGGRLVYQSDIKDKILKLSKWYPRASSTQIGGFLDVAKHKVLIIQKKLIRSKVLPKDFFISKLRSGLFTLKPDDKGETVSDLNGEEDLMLKKGFEDFLRIPRPPKKVIPRKLTPENYQKLRELMYVDPTVSLVEASAILGISRTKMCEMMQKVRNENKSGYSGPNLEVAASGIVVGGDAMEAEQKAQDVTPMPYDAVNTDRVEPDFGGVVDFDDVDFDPMEPSSYPDEEPMITKSEVNVNTLKRKAKKMKQMIKEESRCLICFSRYGSHKGRSDARSWGVPLTPFFSASSSCDISGNLKVIYLLSKIFDMSTSQLVSCMVESEGMNPKDWLLICDSCQELVKEATDIVGQIQRLERKLGEVKMKLFEELRKEQKVPRNVKNMKELRVTNNIRGMVSRQMEDLKVPSLSNLKPEEGDQMAEAMLRLKKESMTPSSSEINSQTVSSYDDDFDDYEPPPNNLPTHGGDEEEMKTGFTSEKSVPQLTQSSSLSGCDLQSKLAICDICGEELRIGALRLHRLRSHGEASDGMKKLECTREGCKYVTIYEAHFKIHIKKHEFLEAGGKFTCNFCGKGFSSKSNLKNHEKIHKNEGTQAYICHLCPASFAIRNYLTQHFLRTHKLNTVVGVDLEGRRTFYLKPRSGGSVKGGQSLKHQ